MTGFGQQIILVARPDVFSALISLFGTLQNVESSKDVKISDDRKTITIQEKDELIKLPFDYKPLSDKIFPWFHSGQPWLTLSKEESDLFRACSHAAYYFIVETSDPEHLKRNHFIKFHEEFIKSK